MKKHSIFRGIVLTRKVSAVLITLALIASILYTHTPETRASGYSLIALSKYSRTLNIGETYQLAAISSSQKRITWKSSSSRIASVNTYGLVTAKKAGTCKITAKVTGGEASCQITVAKTVVTLSALTVSLENGRSYQLRGSTSNGSTIRWRSSRSSVASVSESGRIEAHKPGESTITATADGARRTCKVIVKKPKVRLKQTSVKMYRKQTHQLTATVSSGRTITWKSRKKGVATVNDKGIVTAKKHGTAIITATVDGVTKECEVMVQSPDITLSKSSVTMKKGQTLTLNAKVSSGIPPSWKSSKSNVATVDKNGKITARKKGSCDIHASEDGTKETCHITVTD